MLSIITINYRNAGDTLALLRSMEDQQPGAWDLIVLDNASGGTDGQQLGAYAASSRLPMHLMLNDTNLGFSGGNNVGIRKALAGGAEWVVLLNNDCVVPPGWVSDVVAKLSATEPGLYALPIREDERTAWCGIVTWLAPTLGHAYDEATASHALDRGTGYAVGAAVAIHRSVLEAVGPMDERYFLYFEDAAYSMSARKKGYQVRLLKVSPVEHAVSASTLTLGRPLLLRYHARNALLFNWDHGPVWVRISLPFASLFGILVQAGKLILMPSRRAASMAIARGIVDFYAKRFGPISEDHRP